ncbi:hypothetical protein LZZ85_03630 [Terrimonas sp. NA20]|uniref:FAD assembly factor SdhE n=1 Tax=Terrimonas ginsenosidimutans TaxID=2908004 RepID=A0ABS9KM06_9BACT|nr:hypothetical protein [Terrimonas ginsenosidimutans]MCG2613351.1 hypothetical protein [Terrimonas ginsenosidimutans]
MNRLTYLFAGYLRRDLTQAEESELKVFLGDEPTMRAFEMLLIHEDEIFDDAALAMATATRVLNTAQHH